MAEDDDRAASTEGTEVVALRIEFDLVPEWSNLVERIARHHGEQVEVGYEGQTLVIKASVAAENKPGMMSDITRFWDQFVERRKREGRWKS